MRKQLHNFSLQADLLGFPACCGALVLADLDEDTEALQELLEDIDKDRRDIQDTCIPSAEKSAKIAAVAKEKSTLLQQYAGAYSLQNLEYQNGGEAGGGGYFATTVPRQRKAIARLRSASWKPLFTWRNANTDNPITLWGIATEPLRVAYRNKPKGGR